jgi:hypothetical protein
MKQEYVRAHTDPSFKTKSESPAKRRIAHRDKIEVSVGHFSDFFLAENYAKVNLIVSYQNITDFLLRYLRRRNLNGIVDRRAFQKSAGKETPAIFIYLLKKEDIFPGIFERAINVQKSLKVLSRN